MGANTSQISDLASNQSLKTLVGTEAICENDPFWNQLISFTVVSPTSRYARVAGSILKLPKWHLFGMWVSGTGQERCIQAASALPALLSTVCWFAVNHDFILLPFSSWRRQMFS